MIKINEGLAALYVSQEPGVPGFLWWQGEVVPESDFQTRYDMHQLFAEIVQSSRCDRRFSGVRYARNHRRLLVETNLKGFDSAVERPLLATMVIGLRKGADRLAGATDDAALVLRDNDIPLPEVPLPYALGQAEWKSRNPFDRLVGWARGQGPPRLPA
ncbi:hypothetical protein [Streptomyces marispadix]|uniref:Uncharacterized protein n=1 Tax=Streptomyces marispadix TaxID=2922868 RepID=A0ABS9SSY2_9ACTN|nr:hypothetical protein [Streptomyces marispadix]MCH6159367.1 hypothetical protein [Streptomyces marispadix]